MNVSHLRQELLEWYRGNRRDLPWRRTRDPYAIWISEIMLQQTRVAAVIPYYERFLKLFPNLRSLAEAPEIDLLRAWSGLGYYNRARNLQKAARQTNGMFPTDYHGIRELAGVGDYTAAAVASIAFELPYAAVDGNVLRVLSRVTCETEDIRSVEPRRRLAQTADELLDSNNPGAFNQAMMELGATVCLPRDPQCLVCPVAEACMARRQGRQREFPIKRSRLASVKQERTVLVVERKGRLLFWQRPPESKKLQGFWELPEQHHVPTAQIDAELGTFRHAITNHNYTFKVVSASVSGKPAGLQWLTPRERETVPLSTISRKALRLYAARLANSDV